MPDQSLPNREVTGRIQQSYNVQRSHKDLDQRANSEMALFGHFVKILRIIGTRADTD